MQKTINVRLLHGDDWCALYVDGENIYEHHTISIETFVNIMRSKYPKQSIENIDYQELYCDLEWLEELSGFQKNLSDVVLC